MISKKKPQEHKMGADKAFLSPLLLNNLTSLTVKVRGVNPNACAATPEITHDPIAGASSVVQVLTPVDGSEDLIVRAGAGAAVDAVVVDRADRCSSGWCGDCRRSGGSDKAEDGNGSGQHSLKKSRDVDWNRRCLS